MSHVRATPTPTPSPFLQLLSIPRDWNAAESKLAFMPPEGLYYSTDLWVPSGHNFNDKRYIIF